MTDTNVFPLSQPATFADPLTEVLRNGARALLAQAVEAEVAALSRSSISRASPPATSRGRLKGIPKMKLQDSRPSGPKFLQSQTRPRHENRLSIYRLHVIHGQLKSSGSTRSQSIQ